MKSFILVRSRLKTIMGIALGGAMLVGLPLAGVAAKGSDISIYLEFPPLTRHVAHAPFDITVFVLISAVDLAMVLGGALMIGRAARKNPPSSRVHRPFPAWGRAGLAVILIGWVLAWTRLKWFAPLQPHTFCIPWLGYILAVNALCVQRDGRSLMTDTPIKFLLLFPASACFWWFFEYLNRFVQNWYYVRVADFGPLGYTLLASTSFATVLPAVLSTYRLLLTVPAFNPGLAAGIPVPWRGNRSTALITLLIAGGGLALIGVYPDFLYPVVWVSPLLIITSLQRLQGQPTVFCPSLPKGDWRAVVAAATAALICGFFWEMWNFYSLTRWQYAIPFVDRLHLFAMPLPGYGGYLPFGLECLAIGQILMGHGPLSPK